MFLYEKAFKAKLKTLYPDLTYACNDALSLIRLINGGIDDKTSVIQDLYYHDHVPVKVINPGLHIKGGHYDIEDELISLGEGYDRYLKNMGTKVEDAICRHNVALEILINILSLPDPYARTLYLHYYKGYTVTQIAKEYFSSKTTCYRNIEKGTEMLYKRLSIEEEE
ncbi:MAG: sigma-70 family RNA polymerase sigma factor [Clostridiales bacterium]|nr:sigma-70 family RNA polymerase sigma factor [Clostridiales bacterium]MBP3811453.1 sigma-70 family RNA polymerase sigma factor [Clostridiales bacterium]